MSTIVYKRFYSAPDIDIAEILRYAKCYNPTADITNALTECISECESTLSYSVCYTELPIKIESDTVDFGFMKISAPRFAHHIESCSRVVIFAATVGHELDRQISKYSRTSVARALLADAYGDERIESLCDLFCADIKEEKSKLGYTTVSRFSPGYGDLPLAVQKELFRLLTPYTHLGMSLSESMLLSPSKSVIAIIGFKKSENK